MKATSVTFTKVIVKFSCSEREGKKAANGRLAPCMRCIPDYSGLAEKRREKYNQDMQAEKTAERSSPD